MVADIEALKLAMTPAWPEWMLPYPVIDRIDAIDDNLPKGTDNFAADELVPLLTEHLPELVELYGLDTLADIAQVFAPYQKRTKSDTEGLSGLRADLLLSVNPLLSGEDFLQWLNRFALFEDSLLLRAARLRLFFLCNASAAEGLMQISNDMRPSGRGVFNGQPLLDVVIREDANRTLFVPAFRDATQLSEVHEINLVWFVDQLRRLGYQAVADLTAQGLDLLRKHLRYKINSQEYAQSIWEIRFSHNPDRLRFDDMSDLMGTDFYKTKYMAHHVQRAISSMVSHLKLDSFWEKQALFTQLSHSLADALGVPPAPLMLDRVL